MSIIEISGNTNNESAIGILKLYSKGLNFKIDNKSTKNKTKLLLSKKEIEKKDYVSLADALLEILVDYCIEPIIIKRLREIYPDMNIKPTEIIIKEIKKEIKTSKLYIEEKIEVRDKLTEYLEETRRINLDGYLIFRLQEYVYIVDIAIDSVISEIKEKNRLEEFLSMVQYLLDIQDSKANILNLIIDDGNFKFTDENNDEIGLDIIESVENQLREIEATKSDVLLSSLIIISPKRLILHYNGDEEVLLIKAILEIFEDKVTICHGCNICKLNSELEY